MAKLLDFLVNCSNASPDDVADDLLRMADPDTFDSREEMGDHFEDCIGYNPLNYFDRKSVDDEFDELIKIAPFSVQDQLRSKREDIVERTMSCVGDLTDTVIHKVFLTVVEDTVGWNPIEPDSVSMDECISMSIFGDEEIEDDVESDSEDEEGLDDEIYDIPSDEDDE